MSYGITHNGKVYGPSGVIVDLKPEDVDAYNKQLEASELEWLKTGPEKCTLYIQNPDMECTKHIASATERKGNMYWGVSTWLGTRVGNVWIGDRSISGFQGHYRGGTYRRPITVRIFGTLYHGWWYESSGDYVRLKKVKKQDTVYAATHRNGN